MASPSTRETTGAYLAEEYFLIPPASQAEAGRSFFPTLTPPFRNRATFRYELGRGMYALEQLLAFQNVTVTVRTNVVRMKDGGLWVHGPQWPTGEFMHLLDELGPVRHVVLPCNALEHKAPMRAFVERYPDATVWISPGQYGPFGSCGTTLNEACRMGYRVDGILAASERSADTPPWADEFEYETLYLDLPGNAGPVSEVAFYHKPTRTLLTVDAVVFIPQNRPPSIFETYFDKATVEDPTFWPRTVLQSVFLPLREQEGSDGRRRSYPGFDAIQQRLIRAPILRGFNDARAPLETRQWITRVATKWPFDRVVTSHFASPIVATGRDVMGAFSYLLEAEEDHSSRLPPIACRDWELLDGLNGFITNQKLGAPVVFDYRSDCVAGTSN
jgi:Domain of unknown function (DUF4336)